MLAELQTLTEAVARRVRSRHLIAQTVVVKIRDSSFKTVTRSKSMRAGSNSTMTLYRMARALFENWRSSHQGTAVRLLGMGVSGLENQFGKTGKGDNDIGNQLDSQSEKSLDAVLDSINQRYGEKQIVHGQTLRRKKLDTKNPAKK